ncbi:MAG: hypothetical protein LBQ12_07025, partial [Deltaproteobacteria bacterium]|nr:hypothetical protein [Deltaproteobacteria bacterium]
WFMNVKKILRRAGLTRGECDLVQGICRQIRWAVGNGPQPGRESFPARAGYGPEPETAARQAPEGGAGETRKPRGGDAAVSAPEAGHGPGGGGAPPSGAGPAG